MSRLDPNVPQNRNDTVGRQIQMKFIQNYIASTADLLNRSKTRRTAFLVQEFLRRCRHLCRRLLLVFWHAKDDGDKFMSREREGATKQMRVERRIDMRRNDRAALVYHTDTNT